LPEDKYKLVKAFQKGGHIVGMCGDGANDAPALRQAQIGIAVSTATDVAKSAAGVVLTEAGLVGIVAAVKEGRITFQRILTYTLNAIIKKIVTVLFLVAGLIMTGHAILTPMLMVIVMITGDFLSMSLTTDNVRPSQKPNAWSPDNSQRLPHSPRRAKGKGSHRLSTTLHRAQPSRRPATRRRASGRLCPSSLRRGQ
jgi:H+-transporting ATPase